MKRTLIIFSALLLSLFVASGQTHSRFEIESKYSLVHSNYGLMSLARAGGAVHVSEKLARRIAMAYTSKGQQETPGEGWNLSAELRITNYIVDGQPHVHLIYDCTLWSDDPWSSMENVTIDAHTGRILTYSMAIA